MSLASLPLLWVSLETHLLVRGSLLDSFVCSWVSFRLIWTFVSLASLPLLWVSLETHLLVRGSLLDSFESL